MLAGPFAACVAPGEPETTPSRNENYVIVVFTRDLPELEAEASNGDGRSGQALAAAASW